VKQLKRHLLRLSFVLVALGLFACTPKEIEGQNPGDCTDGVDNDGDGLIDCDDDTCQGSLLCVGSNGDDDDAVGDDDTVGDDDDGNPDTVQVSGTIDAGIQGTGDSEGAVIYEVGNESHSVTTTAEGNWAFHLPRGTSVGLHGSLPGYGESRLYLNLSAPGQDQIVGQVLMFLSEKEFSQFGQFLGYDYDSARGQLFVWAESITLESVAGSTVSIDLDYDESFSLEGETPEQADSLGPDAALLFLNVTPGDVTLTVQMPDGQLCNSADPLPVLPALVTVAFLSCP